MKKIILSTVFLAFFPFVVFAGNGAPYTEDALQKIKKTIIETPSIIDEENLSKEDFIKRYVEYYSKIFEKAGYSFTDTIDQIVDDMKNNPEVIPMDRQSVYNNIYIVLNIMMYECNYVGADCLQFFPPDTKKSIQWFMENNEFSKKNAGNHMGSK
jgi:hypothetical protein